MKRKLHRWSLLVRRAHVTCHSGLEKGTICPTHVTGNSLGATLPPTPCVRHIIPPHHPQPLSQQAAVMSPMGDLDWSRRRCHWENSSQDAGQ